jgi:hypothetical protein
VPRFERVPDCEGEEVSGGGCQGAIVIGLTLGDLPELQETVDIIVEDGYAQNAGTIQLSAPPLARSNGTRFTGQVVWHRRVSLCITVQADEEWWLLHAAIQRHG